MRLYRLAAACASLLFLPALAKAAPLDLFTLSGNGLNLSFALAASPHPEDTDPTLGFFLDRLNFTANGQKFTASPADFFVSSVGGGFALQDDDDLIQYFSFSGPQLFTGSVASPVFTQGTFSLQAVFCPGQDPEGPQTCGSLPYYSLTIAPQLAATPEPGSLALLTTGLLSGFAFYRRESVRS